MIFFESMKILLKNARIFEGIAESRVQDILLRDGHIEAIGDSLSAPKGAEIWQ